MNVLASFWERFWVSLLLYRFQSFYPAVKFRRSAGLLSELRKRKRK